MVKTNIDQKGKSLDIYGHKDVTKDQGLTGGNSQFTSTFSRE